GRELLEQSGRLRDLQMDELAAADLFASAFLPDPQLAEACAEPLRAVFLGELFGTPDYKALHAATRLDEAAAAIAAAAFAEQLAALRKEQEKQPEGSGAGREMAALRAAGRALAEASKEVGEMREAALALGLGPGSPGSNDSSAIAALYKRV